MSETKEKTERPIDYEAAGWGFLIILTVLAMVTSLVLCFFGGSWYWPWLFLFVMIAIFVRYYLKQKAKEGNG